MELAKFKLRFLYTFTKDTALCPQCVSPNAQETNTRQCMLVETTILPDKLNTQ